MLIDDIFCQVYTAPSVVQAASSHWSIAMSALAKHCKSEHVRERIEKSKVTNWVTDPRLVTCLVIPTSQVCCRRARQHTPQTALGNNVQPRLLFLCDADSNQLSVGALSIHPSTWRMN